MTTTLFRTVPRPVTFLALAMAAGACSGAPQPKQLANVETVEPGEVCPDGGILVQIGEDLDGDGVLSEDEVLEQQVICHGESGDSGTDGADGADGVSTFVDVTELPPGDEDCPHGGVRVEIGTEDADGNQNVAHTLYECAPPPEPPVIPGAFSVNVSGGAAVEYDGGAGGSFLVSGDGPDVEVRDTGEAQPPPDKPTPATYLGDEPAVIEGTVTVPVFDEDDWPPDVDPGELFLLTDDEPVLYIWDGDEGTLATGLHVTEGATLEFADQDFDGRLDFAEDVLNEGTITVSDVTTFRIRPSGVYHGTASSTILVEDGGFNFSSGYLFYNEGEVTLARQPGSWGGWVDIWTDRVVNHGDIVVRGGEEDDDGPGGGGMIFISASDGVHNEGLLDVRGGRGDQTGADGGEASIYSSGGIWNSGTIRADGGEPFDDYCADGCGSARGGNIFLSTGGPVLGNAGDLSADGTGSGGDGGNIGISAGGAPGATDVRISGNLSARGGSDYAGGDGGEIEIHAGGTGSLILHGYTHILADGGSGQGSGGSGGSVELACDGGDVFMGEGMIIEPYPSGAEGSVTNHAQVSGTGGPGMEGAGGAGGHFYGDCLFVGELTNHGDVDVRGGASTDDAGGTGGMAWIVGDVVLNTGAVDGDGGSGDLQGGDGGEAIVGGPVSATNEAPITASGGPGSTGGEGGLAVLDSDDVWNGGSLQAAGGEGILVGGAGGWVGAYADAELFNEGDLLAPGADATDADGEGGDGGRVELDSDGFNSVHEGSHDVTGGSGNAQDGEPGEVWIDGIQVDD